MPKFSIIIPTHNSAEFMRKCLDSVVEQICKDYELIIICDKCEDDTETIAREYTDKVIVTDYGNDGMARNAGLDIATGEWVLFLDDDDWWLHEYVLEQLDEKTKTTSADLLAFSFIFKHWMYAKPHHPSGGLWVAVWCKCWKRSFIGSTRFPYVYPSDLAFHRLIMAKNPRVVEWDMPMYYYNFMRKGSQTELEIRGNG